jgi:pyridinium-3,5-bisthiocarboxylic acid mononucleotide nickel chelatase
MKIAYYDCFSGAAGDMILGALLDSGLPLEALKAELSKLQVRHYDIIAEKVTKAGLSGTRVTVDISDKKHDHRNLGDIVHIIRNSGLDDQVVNRSLSVFTRLAEAEARVHRTSVDKIHFHEVGAVDAIVDIVGSVAGMWLMGIEKVVCSPINVGSGTVKCAHGVLPVPAPATTELVKGRPVYSSGQEGELLTPTGAAILTTLASDFGPMPGMRVDKVGYGAGFADRSLPNLLRVLIGEAEALSSDETADQIGVIETNIDDMNPQIYDYLIEKLLGMSALDAHIQTVHMKKNRPGIVLTVLCRPRDVGMFADFILKETSSIGVRWRLENRVKARRSLKELETRYGKLRFKISRVGNRITNITPEYDDCKRVALDRNTPIKVVMDEARRAALSALDDLESEES